MDDAGTRSGSAGADLSRSLVTGLAMLSVGAGVLHIAAVTDHIDMGAAHVAFFVLVAFAQIGWAVRVASAPSRPLLAAGVAGNLAVVAVWLVSRTSGVPVGPGAGTAEPVGFADALATFFEIGIVGGAGLLLASSLVPRLQPARLGSSPGATRFGAGVLTLAMVALVLPGPSHDHSHGEAAHGHDEAAAPGHEDAGHAHEGELAQHESGSHGHGGGEETAAHPAGHGHTPDEAFESAHALFEEHGHLNGSAATETAMPGHDHADSADSPAGNHGAGGHQAAGHQGAGHDEEKPDPHAGQSFWYEPADEDEGAALMFRGSGAGVEQHGHHSDDCRPTPEQQATADRVARETAAELKKYNNNPGLAMRDGFWALPIPLDRLFHMLNSKRIDDPDVVKASEIESFLYAVTDQGLTAIGGMYMMPKRGVHGPKFGGCRTVWHVHGGWQGRLLTAGTSDRTAEMLHVWTYPGLDPYSEYNGRRLSQLWKPGSYVPSICDQHNCLP